jgi:hypothetical protein
LSLSYQPTHLTQMTASVSDPDQLLRLAAEQDDMIESKILSSQPEWDRYERSGILPPGSAKLLSQMHGLDSSALRIIMTSNPEVISLIPLVLANVASEITPSLYLLTILAEACRSDSSIWEMIVRQRPSDFFTPMGLLLGRPSIDQYTADKAIQVLTAIMSHSPDSTFSVQQVKLIGTNLVSGQYKTSQVGVLDGLSNLLKQDAFRKPLFEVFGVE